MNQEDSSPSIGPMLVTFMAGAAIGAVIVALVTPKSGPEMRGDLKDAADLAKRKAADLTRNAASVVDDLKARGRLAAVDIRRGITESVTHLRRRADDRSSVASGPTGFLVEGMGWDGSDGG